MDPSNPKTMRRIAEIFHKDDGTFAGVFAILFAMLAGYVTLQNAPSAQAVFPFETAPVPFKTVRVPKALSGSPMIALDAHVPPAAMFVSQGSAMARSIDHARTFTGVQRSAPGEQSESIAFDAKGALYATRTSEVPTVAVSSDAGRSWGPARTLASRGGFGRAWLTARGDGQIVVSAVERSARRLRVWISGNHARTFIGPFTIPATIDLAGPLLVGPYQSLHQAFIGTGLRGVPYVGYAASADGGRTWSAQRVATISPEGARDAIANPEQRRPVIAVDDLGALYATWVETTSSGRASAIIAISTDHGATWPYVHLPSADAPSIAPTIIAGGFGKIDVAFLRRDGNRWDLVMQHSMDAGTMEPSFISNVVARGVDGTGYALVSDLDGSALLAYGKGGKLMLARQAAGSRLH